MRVEKMARAAGYKGNIILTGNGEKLFICTANLSVLNYCGMWYICMQGKQDLSRQSGDKMSWSCSYSYCNKNI